MLHKFLKKICFSALFRLEVSVLISLGAIFAFELISARADQRELAGEVVRLHIVADSNEEGAQSLKLKVRDRLLAEYSEALVQLNSKAEAEVFVKENLAQIEATAREELQANGCFAPVTAVLKEEVFPGRQYGNVSFPAGEYTALRVIIGRGAGQNWWCVMFPPMCCFAEEAEAPLNKILPPKETPEIKFRWRILEWWERIRS